MEVLAKLAPFILVVCGISISAGFTLGLYPLAIVGLAVFGFIGTYTETIVKNR